MGPEKWPQNLLNKVNMMYGAVAVREGGGPETDSRSPELDFIDACELPAVSAVEHFLEQSVEQEGCRPPSPSA